MNLGWRSLKIGDIPEDDPLRAWVINEMQDKIAIVVLDVIQADATAGIFNNLFAAFKEYDDNLIKKPKLFHTITHELARTGHRDLVNSFLYLMPRDRLHRVKNDVIEVLHSTRGWENYGVYYWGSLPEFDRLPRSQ